jgi:hypothetical protein
VIKTQHTCRFGSVPATLGTSNPSLKTDLRFAGRRKGRNVGHPRTQGLFGKDPGIGWSHDSTKLIAQGGVAKYQITCFHRKR